MFRKPKQAFKAFRFPTSPKPMSPLKPLVYQGYTDSTDQAETQWHLEKRAHLMRKWNVQAYSEAAEHFLTTLNFQVFNTFRWKSIKIKN